VFSPEAKDPKVLFLANSSAARVYKLALAK